MEKNNFIISYNENAHRAVNKTISLEQKLKDTAKEMQQQSWFLDAEVRLKKERDYIILLLIIDCLIGLVAIMM